jgi:hypothetical protein
MDPSQWRNFIAWMRDNELIKKLLPTSEVLSNAYLPGKIAE